MLFPWMWSQLRRVGLLVSWGFLFTGCYSLRVAYEHTGLYLSKEPVEEVLNREGLSEKLRVKLQALEGVLAFARQEGLEVGGSYRDFIDNQGKPISHTVQVAEPYKLKWVTWWYPFVGRVPYRGYFKESERDQEAFLWKKKEYDVTHGTVVAFSGLGWFDDPIYATMLQRGEASLGDLIFHELTHRHVWFKGSVKFNENLASFVGDHLTEKYLVQQGKEDLLKKYRIKKEDKRRYRLWLRELRTALKKYYKTLPVGKPKPHWKEGKERVFKEFVHENPPSFRAYNFLDPKGWNNARVLGESMYLPDLEVFERAYRCSGHVKMGPFLDALKKLEDTRDDLWRSVEQFCQKKEKGKKHE